ncbi:MAG: hypothetical protein QOD38_258, partial [Acidimicrobiaceae bacterium]
MRLYELSSCTVEAIPPMPAKTTEAIHRRVALKNRVAADTVVETCGETVAIASTHDSTEPAA